MRKLGFIVTVMALIGGLAIPALATNSVPDSGHKITICHATRSLANPYVKLTIDVAAWTIDDPDVSDHGPHHTRVKDGVTWSDYVLGDPTAECSLDVTTTTVPT